MMQIIRCRNCNESSVPFGQVSVNVVFSKSVRCCESCNSTRESKIPVFFCSPQCVEEFLEKNKFQDMLLSEI